MRNAATCHPDRLVRANGLCEPCYYIARRRAKGIGPRVIRGRRERTAEDRRRERLLLEHGLTLEQFDELVAAQEARCLICGTQPEILVVDHDHDTGIRRGLLCSPCNRGIGLLGDDVDRVLSAADYLAAARRARSA